MNYSLVHQPSHIRSVSQSPSHFSGFILKQSRLPTFTGDDVSEGHLQDAGVKLTADASTSGSVDLSFDKPPVERTEVGKLYTLSIAAVLMACLVARPTGSKEMLSSKLDLK